MGNSQRYVVCPKCQTKLIWKGKYEQIKCSNCGTLINVVPKKTVIEGTRSRPAILGLDLDSDEAVILKETHVVLGNVIWHWDAHEVTLTNKNIIIAVGAAMGRPSAIIKYPLQMIKMFEGKPQVLITTSRDRTLVVEIHFINGDSEMFEFEDDSVERYNIFVQEINKLLCPPQKETNNSTDNNKTKPFYNHSCPNCGGRMKPDQYGFKAECIYCGTEVVLDASNSPYYSGH